MQNLPDQIIEIVSTLPDQDPLVAQRYLERVKEGLLTRDENNRSHFCVYFLPYDSKAKKVFIIHHKKANLWLAPGGHVDKNEDILHALNREVKEELGVDNAFAESSKPFLLSITPIDNNTQPCKEHFDIWFLFLNETYRFDEI